VKGRKRARRREAPSEPFIMVPTDLLTSPDWVRLPPAARAIFLDMCRIHRHGGPRAESNNGRIGYGCATAGKAANASAATGHRMLKALREHALIILRKAGRFKINAEEGEASEWEITIYPMAGRPYRSWGERKLAIEHWLLESGAYRGLSNQARCILVELMRRHDGGNNGRISFGGADGSYVGLSRDVSERALTELEHARFIKPTTPAVPHLRHPRKWHLAMYAADGKPATKDFMRELKPASTEASRDRFIGAVAPPQNVSTMRSSNSTRLALQPESLDKNPNRSNQIRQKGRDLGTHASETIDAPDTRAHEIHLEASPVAAGLPLVCDPIGPQSEQRSTKAAKPAERAYIALPQLSPVPRVSDLGDLFGGALPLLRGPDDELRLELRTVLARRRGTQSRLAESLGLSRSTFAHALSGRSGFSPAAAAALRKWLEGEPMAGDWPVVAAAAEDGNAA
jgi:hypothetical protein